MYQQWYQQFRIPGRSTGLALLLGVAPEHLLLPGWIWQFLTCMLSPGGSARGWKMECFLWRNWSHIWSWWVRATEGAQKLDNLNIMIVHSYLLWHPQGNRELIAIGCEVQAIWIRQLLWGWPILMSQGIGPVTLSHSMSLVITLTQDWAPPVISHVGPCDGHH